MHTDKSKVDNALYSKSEEYNEAVTSHLPVFQVKIVQSSSDLRIRGKKRRVHIQSMIT